MTDNAKKITTVTGNVAEEYVSTYSHLIDWLSKDELVVVTEGSVDLNFNVSSRTAAALIRAVGLAPKSRKMLTSEDDWADFRKLFSTAAKLAAVPLTFKAEHGDIVGFVPEGSTPIPNSESHSDIISSFLTLNKVKQMNISEDAEYLTAVMSVGSSEEAIEFMGLNWRRGVAITTSSLGLCNLTLTSCLIPGEGNPCAYSLPSELDAFSLEVLPENVSEFLENGLLASVISIADGAYSLANLWEKALDNKISLFEFNAIAKAFTMNADTAPEMQMAGRYALAFDCFGVSPDDAAPNRKWLESAYSGTTLRELFEKAFTIPVDDPSWINYPHYAVAHYCENPLTLENVAIPRRSLSEVCWPE